MCLAPRYISGPMARPCSPCRNTASLPATPCASRPAAKPASRMTAARPTTLLALILRMAGVTRVVDVRPRGRDAVGVLRAGRPQRHLRPVHEGPRHRNPIPGVDHPAAEEQQVARFA